MFIAMKVSGLTIDPFTNSPILLLKDLEEKEVLPIWIGLLEAGAIAMELDNIQFSRPMTHDLLKNILNSLDVKVEKIEVNDLRNNTFFATIHLIYKGNELLIDSRPSDAIALALRTKSPIYVSEEVLLKSKKVELDKKEEGESKEDAKKWEEILEKLNPEDFGKYKM
ncbi:MAG: bifunctional nuclease family protein [Deltaproteobacteria bacterium]|nr:MAG: bifunctional nuclease family protein [Deltaproteobacteria bacterium]